MDGGTGSLRLTGRVGGDFKVLGPGTLLLCGVFILFYLVNRFLNLLFFYFNNIFLVTRGCGFVMGGFHCRITNRYTTRRGVISYHGVHGSYHRVVTRGY